MKLKKLNSKKSKAQAMVEFAIALPVLLVLLYGIMETGRLLFLYSTVVTASRQAVRYGSVIGLGNGTGNVNEPRYQDCDGIRSAAQQYGYLGAFDTVSIAWDDGPSTSPTIYCTDPSTDGSFTPKKNNTSRVSVTVSKQFVPIVPKLLPFKLQPITATSSRTILVGVSVEVTGTFSPATVTKTSTITLTPTKTFTPTRTPTITLTPLVSYTPSKTPTITLTPINSRTPTATLVPSATPTRVSSCNTTHGPITYSGNTMTMQITNPNPFPITTGDGSVSWYYAKGHQTGGDKTLNLVDITIEGTDVWPGPTSSNVATMPWSDSAIIPPGATVTITFTFHQSYDSQDGTESILINLTTPGCEGFPINS